MALSVDRGALEAGSSARGRAFGCDGAGSWRKGGNDKRFIVMQVFRLLNLVK